MLLGFLIVASMLFSICGAYMPEPWKIRYNRDQDLTKLGASFHWELGIGSLKAEGLLQAYQKHGHPKP